MARFHNPDEEQLFRDLWEDETQQEVVIESLRAYSASSGREDLRTFEIRLEQRICAEEATGGYPAC
jgi:hypothetical protein